MRYVISGIAIGVLSVSGCAVLEKACGGGKAKQEMRSENRNTNETLPENSDEYPSVDVQQLQAKLAVRSVILIDANGSESYREGHLPGALDFEAMENSLPEGLPPDKASAIIVYCGGPRCMAWKRAADALRAMGYANVSHFPGGLSEWFDAGLAIDSTTAPNVVKKDSRMPMCSLSSGDQEERFKRMRSGLFNKQRSFTSKEGSVSFEFPADPHVEQDLLEFIQFERQCCTGLGFALGWNPRGTAATLTIEGANAELKALKALISSNSEGD